MMHGSMKALPTRSAIRPISSASGIGAEGTIGTIGALSVVSTTSRMMGAALVIGIMLGFVPTAVQAQSVSQVRSWAAACANCHGTHGKAMPGMVALAGMPSSVIVQKMLDYKNDKASATVMHQLAKGYEESQIKAIADYFAAQK